MQLIVLLHYYSVCNSKLHLPTNCMNIAKPEAKSVTWKYCMERINFSWDNLDQKYLHGASTEYVYGW